MAVRDNGGKAIMGVDPYPGAAKAGWMAGPGVASVERRLDRGNLASSRRILPAPMMTGTTRLIPRSTRRTSEAIPEYWRQHHCRRCPIWSNIAAPRRHHRFHLYPMDKS